MLDETHDVSAYFVFLMLDETHDVSAYFVFLMLDETHDVSAYFVCLMLQNVKHQCCKISQMLYFHFQVL